MAQRRGNRTYNVRINLDNVKIGGGAYAQMAGATEKAEQRALQKKPNETDEYLQEFKDVIGTCSGYYWLMLRENYDQIGLSEAAYLEIAKCAIDALPTQMNRLRDDKLSPNSYYQVCQVMAKHGACFSVNCDKLSQARGNGQESALYEIMSTALLEWLVVQDYRIEELPRAIDYYLTKERESFRKPDYACLIFFLWLCSTKVSCTDIANMVNSNEIRQSNISRVTDAILNKIKYAKTVDFMSKVPPLRLRDDQYVVPPMVRDAYYKIMDAMSARADELRRQEAYRLGLGRSSIQHS